jgi:hypothetical protein
MGGGRKPSSIHEKSEILMRSAVQPISASVGMAELSALSSGITHVERMPTAGLEELQSSASSKESAAMANDERFRFDDVLQGLGCRPATALLTTLPQFHWSVHKETTNRRPGIPLEGRRWSPETIEKTTVCHRWD